MPPLLAGPGPEIKTNSPGSGGARKKKDAAEAASCCERGRADYLATALTRAAALSVCSQVKNLKFLSPALRPKCPYWLVRE